MGSFRTELRLTLKPAEWKDHQTANILLIESFLEIGGNLIPGFPSRVDVLACLEKDLFIYLLKFMSALCTVHQPRGKPFQFLKDLTEPQGAQ